MPSTNNPRSPPSSTPRRTRRRSRPNTPPDIRLPAVIEIPALSTRLFSRFSRQMPSSRYERINPASTPSRMRERRHDRVYAPSPRPIRTTLLNDRTDGGESGYDGGSDNNDNNDDDDGNNRGENGVKLLAAPPPPSSSTRQDTARKRPARHRRRRTRHSSTTARDQQRARGTAVETQDNAAAMAKKEAREMRKRARERERKAREKKARADRAAQLKTERQKAQAAVAKQAKADRKKAAKEAKAKAARDKNARAVMEQRAKDIRAKEDTANRAACKADRGNKTKKVTVMKKQTKAAFKTVVAILLAPPPPDCNTYPPNSDLYNSAFVVKGRKAVRRAWKSAAAALTPSSSRGKPSSSRVPRPSSPDRQQYRQVLNSNVPLNRAANFGTQAAAVAAADNNPNPRRRQSESNFRRHRDSNTLRRARAQQQHQHPPVSLATPTARPTSHNAHQPSRDERQTERHRHRRRRRSHRHQHQQPPFPVPVRKWSLLPRLGTVETKPVLCDGARSHRVRSHRAVIEDPSMPPASPVSPIPEPLFIRRRLRLQHLRGASSPIHDQTILDMERRLRVAVREANDQEARDRRREALLWQRQNPSPSSSSPSTMRLQQPSREMQRLMETVNRELHEQERAVRDVDNWI